MTGIAPIPDLATPLLARVPVAGPLLGGHNLLVHGAAVVTIATLVALYLCSRRRREWRRWGAAR